MNRRLTTQDISWFLDLYRNNQIDLDPPYQRRSVWTTKDRRFFLDTIFRDYPSPAIFLHKELSETGKVVHHVVDGKQRLETIIQFVENKISIDKNYGDASLAGKTWKKLESEPTIKKKFWDYVLSVEFIDTVEGIIVNDVFDRLNRNSRKLERQELRHAKYDGWFITTAEAESEKEEWKELAVVTATRARRMNDVQFISELLLILLQKQIDGFDQDYIDKMYATYELPQETIPYFSRDDFMKELEYTKKYLLTMEKYNNSVTDHAKGLGNFYSLWAVVVLNKMKLSSANKVAKKYKEFMDKVDILSKEKDPEEYLEKHKTLIYKNAYKYFRNSVQASTDQPQRKNRHDVLNTVLLGQK